MTEPEPMDTEERSQIDTPLLFIIGSVLLAGLTVGVRAWSGSWQTTLAVLFWTALFGVLYYCRSGVKEMILGFGDIIEADYPKDETPDQERDKKLSDCPQCNAIVPDGSKTCPQCGNNLTLIDCPDCGSEISRRANSCPECGAPITGIRQPHGTDPPETQTIEETAKKWKAMQLIGGAGFIFSLFLLCSGHGSSIDGDPNLFSAARALIFILSIIVYSYGRIAAWWYHG